ncbi:MAG: hypothetical protein Q4P30_05160 [Eubacteriales bacterium]|nr:hypothetical protein [Eubacteriales bacterium]
MNKRFKLGALLLIGALMFTSLVPNVAASRPSRPDRSACPGPKTVVDVDKFKDLSKWSATLTALNPLANAADLVFKGPEIYKDQNGIPNTSLTTLVGKDGKRKHAVSVPEGEVMMKMGAFYRKDGGLDAFDKYYKGPVFVTAKKKVDIAQYKTDEYEQKILLHAEFATYGNESATKDGKPNAGGDYAYVEAVFLDAAGTVIGSPIRDASYNGGQGVTSHESANPDAWMQFDESVIIPEKATAVEWRLVGVAHDAWNLDAYFKSAEVSVRKKAFQVTFKDEPVGEEAGATLSTACVVIHEKPVPPAPPEKDGKTFIGWFDENEKKLTDTDTVVREHVYTARYEKTPSANTVQTIVDKVPTVDDYNKVITDGDGNPYPEDTKVTVTKIVTQPDVTTATGDGSVTATITVRVEKEGEEPFEVDIPVPVVVTDWVIPQTDGGTERPDGVPADYVKVNINPTEKGTLPEGEATVYWVTPEKEVTIPASNPTGQLVGTDYYTFTDWNAELTSTFTTATTITANYDKIEDVIPHTGGGEERPDGVPTDYVKVTIDPTDKGDLPEGEPVSYWVNPKKEVTIPAGNPTGKTVETVPHTFDQWNTPLTGTFTTATKITAEYTVPNLIPQTTPEKPGTIPADYVPVTVNPTDKGDLPAGEPTVYWVDPGEEVTIPASNPTGKTVETVPHTFAQWNTSLTGTFTTATEITAEYTVPDLIPQTTPEKPGTVPENYVSVTVNPTDKGDLPAGEPTVYWVNPEKKVTIPVSNPTGKTVETVPHTFDQWDTPLTGMFTTTTEITAEYTVPDLIPQTTPEKPGTVPADYVKVTIDATEKGDLPDGTVTTYWVKPDTEVALPEVTATGKRIGADDFVFDKWDSAFKRTFTGDTVITAEYTEQDDVIPQAGDDKPDGIPDDYVKITFIPTDKGELPEGASSIYWVNPRTDVSIPVPDAVGQTIDTVPYTFNGWNAEITGRFTEEKEISATYTVPDVIAETDGRKPSEVPENYVPIELDPTIFGDLPEGTATRYWVNPEVEVTIPAGVPNGKIVGDVPYTFTEWDKPLTGRFTKGGTVTAKYSAPPVIVQTGDKKPEGVPADYVQVRIDPTENGSLPGDQPTIFWVDPKRSVSLDVKDPTGKGGHTFDRWDKALKGTFDKDTVITAKYKKQVKRVPKRTGKGRLPGTGAGGMELMTLIGLTGAMLLRRGKRK